MGISLWSRLPLNDSEIRYLVSADRPSIRARIRMKTGDDFFFVGLHPTPPGLEKRNGGRHDSRIRDAELVLVAKEVAQEPTEHWVVTGDFNDVAWSHTTRLFEKISGLCDPRVGRGLFSTYHAKYRLLRYPVDHAFVSAGASLAGMKRVRAPGSDHFAIYVSLVFEKREGARPKASPADRQEAQEILDVGRKHAG